MPRYAGIKNDRIYLISSETFSNKDCYVYEVPKELDAVSSSDLITNYRFTNEFKFKLEKKVAKNIKLACIGNLGMHCGIATYNEKLWSAVVGSVGDYKLFIEEGGTLQIPFPSEKVIPCWKRGESLKKLVKQIKEYQPDVIWINHEFGLFPNAAYFLSMMSQLSDFRILTTMHSVFEHADKTICEAAMQEVVVHLEGAKNLLKNVKHISGEVYVISHGCEPCVNKEKLWNFYKTPYTVIQFGFGFKYKQYEHSIKAVHILKQKYPNVFYTGLFSESEFNKPGHRAYYNELMQLIKKLDVEDNVALIRGFQSDTTLDSYLRTNKVAVFPYGSQPGHEVFGASGAARIAMAAGLPVITSSIPHFSDLLTIKADTPEAIAEELGKLFSSQAAVDWQVDRQSKYLEENTWDKIAGKYINIFENPPCA